MRALLAALCLTLCAWGPTLAQTITPQQVKLYTSPLQALNVTMGAQDEAGFGGVDLSEQVVGLPTLVSVTNNTTHTTCLSSCDHAIDGWGHLVWRGTYGAAPAAAPITAASYTDVVQDSLGVLHTVNVTVCAKCSFVRSHYVAPNYTVAGGYSLTNPDSAASFQLRTLLNSSAFKLDYVIHMRDEAGTSGLTPALNPWYWEFAPSLNTNQYAVTIPGTANQLASYTFADGSGAARIIDSGSSGTTLSWTSMAASTGTGLKCADGPFVVAGPGVRAGTTGTCSADPGTGAGSLTLSQPLLSTFVAGETVVVTGQILVDSEHPNGAVNDVFGNPERGGRAEIGELRVNGAADFYLPVLLQDLTFNSTVTPGGQAAVFCGALSSNGAFGGSLLTVYPFTPNVTYTGCNQASRGTLALGQAMSGWTPNSTISNYAGGTYIIRTAANSNGTDCNGSACTGTGNPNPATPETYRVDTGNLTSAAADNACTAAGAECTLTSGLFGSFGGLVGNGTATQMQLYNSAGWGLAGNRLRFTVDDAITDNQLARNGMFSFGANLPTLTNSNFHRGDGAITTNPGPYAQRTGTVSDGCTGTQPALTCAQGYILGNVADTQANDFIDMSVNTADMDIENSFNFNQRPNYGQVVETAGDTFTITDTTASTSKTYTFVNSVTGGGNVDGNVPIDPNPNQTQMNMLCTVNAAHNTYVQISPFSTPASTPTVRFNNAPTTFLCRDGINLPAAETADPSVVATMDEVNGPFPAYFLPLLPKTPGDTIATPVWYAAIFNQNQAPGTTSLDCASPAPPCALGQFSTGAFTSSTTLPVSAVSSGQVTLGAVITAVSGSPTGITSSTRVVSLSGAGAPGGAGSYVLSNAISCPSACVFKQTLANVVALQQSTLHPDFIQNFTLSTSNPSNPVPYTALRNISVRGNAGSNYLSGQGFSDNGINACCLTTNVQNNIVLGFLTNMFEVEMMQNSTIARNTLLTDIAAPFFDPSVTSNYNAQLGYSMLAPNPQVALGGIYESCPNTGGANNALVANISGAFVPANLIGGGAKCPTPTFTETPSVEVGLAWLQASEAPVSSTGPSARYAKMFPNYPASLGGGSGACGTTRQAIIACMAPARGQIFTGSIDSSCNITTAVMLTPTLGVMTHINGPGIPAATVNQTDAHITAGDGSSGNPYQLGGITAAGKTCTAAGSAGSGATFSTGAENVDGTYSGALFPADNAGVVSWDDGTVFNPAATHTPAQ